MVQTAVAVQGLSDALGASVASFVSLKKVAAPFTTITNRAQVTDFTQDLWPRMGVERIIASACQDVQGEYGPSGEKVFKPINDIHDQIRYVGNILQANSTAGQLVFLQDTSAYIEVTFYGTGLNAMILCDSNSRAMQAAVDGGVAGSNLYVTSSAVLNSRFTGTNQIVNLASGLALGLHTVKITNVGSTFSLSFYGFEVLNTTATLQLVPGTSYQAGKKLSKVGLTTDSHNSNFESGTLGTRGGHVVVYQKSDGSVAKAVQPTDASALTYPNANHINESVIRVYSWREFGSNRSDDFTTLAASNSTRAFTLDDNVTSLICSQSATSGLTTADTVIAGASTGDFLTFIFVGTGVDIDRIDTAAGGTDTFTYSIDGGAGITLSTTGLARETVQKIASGLPYGTHILKIQRTNSPNTYHLSIRQFIVYGPKKPTIPTGATEIGDYYLMANFVANSTVDINSLSVGTLKKVNIREHIYVGTWTVGALNAGYGTGFPLNTSTNGDFLTFSFYGTGFDFRFDNTAVAATMVMTLDGASNFTVSNSSPTGGAGWTGALTTSQYGGTSFTASTATLVTGTNNLAGNGVVVSGLTLGLHTIKVQKTAGATAVFYAALDIITPIHSPKSNVPGDSQNTLSVGNQGMGDSRVFPNLTVRTQANWTQAIGLTSSPTVTATAFVPVPDMQCIVKTTGGPIEVFYSGVFRGNTTAMGIGLQLYVDGAPIGTTNKGWTQDTAAYDMLVSDSVIVPVAAGVHTVQLFWQVSANSALSTGQQRTIKAREIS